MLNLIILTALYQNNMTLSVQGGISTIQKVMLFFIHIRKILYCFSNKGFSNLDNMGRFIPQCSH